MGPRDPVSTPRAGRRAYAVQALLWLLAAACALAESAQSRPGDPPRLFARNMLQYRHLQFFNPEYESWVAANIKAEQFEVDQATYTHRWESLSRDVPPDQQEAVLVTQTTISRLQNFVRMASEWGGPVSLAVFVDHPKGAPLAADCVSRVETFMKDFTRSVSIPLALSFLYNSRSRFNEPCAVPEYESPVPGSSFGRTRSEFLGLGDAPVQIAGDAAVAARGATGQRSMRDSGLRGGAIGRGPQPGFQRMRQRRRRVGGAIPLRARPDPAAAGGGRRALRATAEGEAQQPLFVFRRTAPFTEIEFTERPFLDVYNDMHPINSLRNLAFEMVPKGAFVFLLDVDFMPSPQLYSKLLGELRGKLAEARAAFAERGERRALIVPAFERSERPDSSRGRSECGNLGVAVFDGRSVPRTVSALRCMIQAQLVDVFHRQAFVAGHMCYSWLTWLQDEKPKHALEIEYHHPCEPYVIALSEAMPRYDERFRGRGMNKVEQLTHMAAWGFQWEVVPAEFVIHLPHTSEPAAKEEKGADVGLVPRVLMKVQAKEWEREPEFKTRVPIQIPVPHV